MRLNTATPVPCRSGHRRASTLIEVLVAMVILLTGVVAIGNLIPMSLRQNQRTLDRSQAAFLAQLKAEEVRRDNYTTGPGRMFIDEIASSLVPTTPIDFPNNTRFAYQFSGVSEIDPVNNPGVARVIVSYSTSFKPNGGVLFELAFQQ